MIYSYIIFTLWQPNITMEHHNVYCNGQINYKWQFSIAMLVITRGYMFNTSFCMCLFMGYWAFTSSAPRNSAKDNMKRNVDAMITRGESLDALVQKSNDLCLGSMNWLFITTFLGKLTIYSMDYSSIDIRLYTIVIYW